MDIAEKENGATNCPILLIFTVGYKITYTKGNWIEGKNVIRCYYIFFGFYWILAKQLFRIIY